ncbi:DUF6538 domain-containing protein [Sphingomonas baiyangensis]|uniref:DUF6538 domain-containing protein n=1 Tax=Sphingomonas baiyangensis TaxID=2572576 RepID=UPI0010AE8E86|nr:DUF6538 domain-containing protein [Sphingomonas baiyangensis]
MAKIKGCWQDPRSGIYYIRREIPAALRPSFACGDFYKVSLGTGDLREAEKRFAVANGEYERKVAAFREALTKSGEGRLTLEQAAAFVNRHLTSRSPSGFASGGMQVAFILIELDRAVADLAGAHLPTAQSMSAEEWAAYRKRLAGSDIDEEFSHETLGRIEAEREARHAPPGHAWVDRPVVPHPRATDGIAGNARDGADHAARPDRTAGRARGLLPGRLCRFG